MKAPQWQGKFYDESVFHQYQVSLNYAMIINKGKNVFPLTTLQAFIDTISMMLGIAIYGQILSGFK